MTEKGTPQAGLGGQLFRVGFRTLARLRGGRALHPNGLMMQGALQRSGRDDEPVAITARMSKGAGLPGRLPDALGLAVRVPSGGGESWDLTLTSSGTGPVGRLLPLPARDWTSAHYSTLLPYRRDGELFWLTARTETSRRAEASVAALKQLVAEAPVTFLIETVRPNGLKEPYAELNLTEFAEDAPRPAFDPVLHSPPGWDLRPGWFTDLRQRAYEGSREGRRA